MNQKKCFMENKARQKWYRKKKSIELDDYPLECRKEADVELITALLVWVLDLGTPRSQVKRKEIISALSSPWQEMVEIVCTVLKKRHKALTSKRQHKGGENNTHSHPEPVL